MIINCTPHVVDVYGPDAPGTIPEGAEVAVVLSIPPSGMVARIDERLLDGFNLAPRAGAEAVEVLRVEYGHVIGLPDVKPKAWYVVSLPVALAVPARPDLLVPYRQVRNARGTVIGCRGFARPC